MGVGIAFIVLFALAALIELDAHYEENRKYGENK